MEAKSLFNQRFPKGGLRVVFASAQGADGEEVDTGIPERKGVQAISQSSSPQGQTCEPFISQPFCTTCLRQQATTCGGAVPTLCALGANNPGRETALDKQQGDYDGIPH